MYATPRRITDINIQQYYNISHIVMNITIRLPGTDTWSASPEFLTPSMRDTYASYKEDPEHLHFREKPYVSDEWIVYRPDNDPYSNVFQD